ncbi:MAG: tRNA (adenosine(37)-N6)-threonylcarbamoyltransferase complex ATPase subunit type 1 TsaE [Rhizomicrobium sp.]
MTDRFRMIVALADLAATEALGAAIAAHLGTGDVVLLDGDLGSGKTTLARAILAALGVAERVPSPTFTLAQAYRTPRLAVTHYDLYRLKRASEMDELGMEEALEQGAILVEWPDRASGRLPGNALLVRLEAETERHAILEGPAAWRSLEKANA